MWLGAGVTVMSPGTLLPPSLSQPLPLEIRNRGTSTDASAWTKSEEEQGGWGGCDGIMAPTLVHALIPDP